MPSEDLIARLVQIQTALLRVAHVEEPDSAASRKLAVECFAKEYLAAVFPDSYHFGSGQIIDHRGRRAGPFDLVLEAPLFPRVIAAGAGSSRLYLAEGVAAVIDIRIDLEREWPQVETAASQVQDLAYASPEKQPHQTSRGISYFAVGYTGWKDKHVLQERCRSIYADGLLVIDSGLFVRGKEGEVFKTMHGVGSLWGLVLALHEAAQECCAVERDLTSYLPLDLVE